MFRSKADLILSRYRPIAPKPLPPSGSLGTDLSSTCVSLDSYASSCKPHRARKRRIAPSSSGKSSKTPKSEKPQIVSAAVSINNAGVSVSSLTQGNSDATVPLTDLSHVSHSLGVQGHVGTTPHMMMDVLERPCMTSGDPAVLGTPFTHHLAGSILEQARMFMVSDSRKVRQLPSLSLSPHPRGQAFASGGMIEKEVAFMDRAAASTILPERVAPGQGLSCGGVCMKGVTYGGGGFTEMIRGITHLRTAADVQSLMQARTGTQTVELGVMAASAENIPCGHTGSPGCTELHPRQLEVHPPVPMVAEGSNPGLPVRLSQAEDCTLSLLPNIPTKSSLSTAIPQAAPEMHDSSYKVKPLAEYATDLHVGFAAGSSYEDISVPFAAVGQIERGQLGSCKQAKHEANNTEMPQSSCFFPTSRLLDGVVPSCVPPALGRDGATVDQVYLQQVYGGSTDPVLLLDDSNQVLWFNKAYDRALKSVSDRLSSKPATTGPYIDPLGHPTPLGSLVLDWGSGTTKSVNTTLWGFLRKLVMPEVVAPAPMTRDAKFDVSRKDSLVKDSDSSRLSLCVGERWPQSDGERSQQSSTHAFGSSVPACRLDVANEVQGCGFVGKLSTVTLECITEVYMGEGAGSVECVEMVEARLGAEGSAPAFITDCTSRVRWVNTAFKQMLGQPEQQGSNVVTMGSSNVPFAKREPPDLIFVCSAEKIPRSALAFSGLVNLEWMKAGKRRSMTVPCDVSRLLPAATWVWKFDVALSLSLNHFV